MLRNRFRVVTKQALMTDHSSQSPPTQNFTRTNPSFFGSSRFRAFIFPEGEPMMSPTSVLDPTKSFSLTNFPFWYEANQPRYPKVFSETKHSWEKLDSKGIGVALVNDPPSENPIEEIDNSLSKPSNRKVLFGTNLRVQIPPLPNSTLPPAGSPKSPADFGIKTRNTQLSSGIQTKDSPRVFTGSLSMNEMELSEDYTCVISHGPNPKTTHIFDNCVVKNYCSLSDKPKSAPENLLSVCCTCKKNLEQKIDIYIYRGEKAFCSQECRYQEMLIDEVEN